MRKATSIFFTKLINKVNTSALKSALITGLFLLCLFLHFSSKEMKKQKDILIYELKVKDSLTQNILLKIQRNYTDLQRFVTHNYEKRDSTKKYIDILFSGEKNENNHHQHYHNINVPF